LADKNSKKNTPRQWEVPFPNHQGDLMPVPGWRISGLCLLTEAWEQMNERWVMSFAKNILLLTSC
jgi:hypothetical protein